MKTVSHAKVGELDLYVRKNSMLCLTTLHPYLIKYQTNYQFYNVRLICVHVFVTDMWDHNDNLTMSKHI